MYNYLYKKNKDGFLISCSTDSHAYSIISIIEKNNNNQNNYLFQIRNPWSSISYKEKQLFNNFIQNYNDCMEIMDENNNINYVKLNKYLDNEGIFFLDKNQFKNYFRRMFNL